VPQVGVVAGEPDPDGAFLVIPRGTDDVEPLQKVTGEHQQARLIEPSEVSGRRQRIDSWQYLAVDEVPGGANDHHDCPVRRAATLPVSPTASRLGGDDQACLPSDCGSTVDESGELVDEVADEEAPILVSRSPSRTKHGGVEECRRALPVDLSWPATVPRRRVPGRLEKAFSAGDLAVEVAWVERCCPHDLVDAPQFRDGELRAAEGGGQR